MGVYRPASRYLIFSLQAIAFFHLHRILVHTTASNGSSAEHLLKWLKDLDKIGEVSRSVTASTICTCDKKVPAHVVKLEMRIHDLFTFYVSCRLSEFMGPSGFQAFIDEHGAFSLGVFTWKTAESGHEAIENCPDYFHFHKTQSEIGDSGTMDSDSSSEVEAIDLEKEDLCVCSNCWMGAHGPESPSSGSSICELG